MQTLVICHSLTDLCASYIEIMLQKEHILNHFFLFDVTKRKRCPSIYIEIFGFFSLNFFFKFGTRQLIRTDSIFICFKGTVMKTAVFVGERKWSMVI